MKPYQEKITCVKCGNGSETYYQGFDYVYFPQVCTTYLEVLNVNPALARPQHLRVTCRRCAYMFWMETKDTEAKA